MLGTFTMIYFDERGISRRYTVEAAADEVRWHRDEAGFAQRMVVTIAPTATDSTRKGRCRTTAARGRTTYSSPTNASTRKRNSQRPLRCANRSAPRGLPPNAGIGTTWERKCPIRGELSWRRRRRLGEPMGDEQTEPAAFDDPAEAIRRAAAERDASGMTRRLLRSTGPRLLRDILGPTLSFYAGWKVSGNVVVGIALGTTFSLAAYRYERRRGRPGAIAQLVLAFVVLQAVIGLATGSAEAYLIQPAILGSINGAVWLGSVVIGKPLAAVFAREVFPIDEETRASEEFHLVFRHVSLVFGTFFLVFAAVQLAVLIAVGIDAFVALRVLDAVLILALIVYAVRYAVDHLGGRMQLAA